MYFPLFLPLWDNRKGNKGILFSRCLPLYQVTLRIPHKGKNKGKYISFHYLMGWKACKIRKVQEISPQIPICISVCFKNGQLRLELPTHLSLQNPTALPLPCFALLDFVVVTSGENKYSLCSCLFSCWCSKLCDFFLLAPISASIDVSLM